MSNKTANKFIECLEQSGLLDKTALASALAEFEASEAANQNLEFDEFLLRQGLITPWHRQRLNKGKTKPFFLGKYKLLGHLGKGGMGMVYLAEHIWMKRRVAIKILPKAAQREESKLQQFLSEARAIAAVNHPNIVQAYSVDNQAKIYYLVMEFVDGRDLERITQEEGVCSPERAVEYIWQAASGLAHVQEKGMIHRDIKPSNLLVNRRGHVKILDLGLAMLADDTGNQADGPVMGTTDYMAPEQAMSLPDMDHRADLYSLGCTMFFLLTGQPPFPSNTLAEALIKHQTQSPPPFSRFRDDVSADLEAICLKLMAKKPADRYQTAGELKTALEEWLTLHHITQNEETSSEESTGEVSLMWIDWDGAANQGEVEDDKVNSFLCNLTQLNLSESDPESLFEDTEECQAAPPIPTPWRAILVSLTLLISIIGGGGWYGHTWWQSRQQAQEEQRLAVIEAAKQHASSFGNPSVEWDGGIKAAKKLPAFPAQVDVGKFGKALQCNPQSFQRLPHKAEWESPTLSLTAWIKPQTFLSHASQKLWIVSKNGSETDDGFFGLGLQNNKPVASLNIGDKHHNIHSVTAGKIELPPEEWCHLALTYDSQTLRLYVNGNEAATKSVKKTRTNTIGSFGFGCSANGSDPNAFVGKLDEVRLFKRALTPGEIHAQFTATKLPTSPPADQIAYWNFDKLPLPKPLDAKNLAKIPENFHREKSALMLLCGHESQPCQVLENGYGFEALKVIAQHEWLGAAWEHCWAAHGDLEIYIHTPPNTAGKLKCFLVNGNKDAKRKMKLQVEAKDIADIQHYAEGKLVVTPITSEDTADGLIHIKLVKTGQSATVISGLSFEPQTADPVKFTAGQK